MTTVGEARAAPAVLEHIPIAPLTPARFQEVLDPDVYGWMQAMLGGAREMMTGRAVWCINSTGKGGGVAEMLRSLLAYVRGAGIDARWTVIEGNTEFFAITKRMHNRLHGSLGDGGPLGPHEREVYESTLAANAEVLSQLVRPGDVVLLHDPQTASLASAMRDAGAHVVWRSHIGIDEPNEIVRETWDFLLPYVRQAHHYVFSRRRFVWDGLEDSRVTIIPPSIDVFSAKNQQLDDEAVHAILRASGLEQEAQADEAARFAREDGTPSRVQRHSQVLEVDPVGPDDQLVVQVSRWDRLKDPIGVLEGFVHHTDPRCSTAHLLLAGPAVSAVADDPEGLEVLNEVREAWCRLPFAQRARVHIACLPMHDTDENAAIVNALQRRADVVVQKSIAEGFGLTVAEAMWKGRPMVASGVGGILDQIIDGETGLVLPDPTDLPAYGRAVSRLLLDSEEAKRMGDEARRRVRELFLESRHLGQWVDVIRGLLASENGAPSGVDTRSIAESAAGGPFAA